jgi:hypothetical protein
MTHLISSEIVFPLVVDPLDDGLLDARGRKKVRDGRAVAERVHRPPGPGFDAQFVIQPVVACNNRYQPSTRIFFFVRTSGSFYPKPICNIVNQTHEYPKEKSLNIFFLL